MSWLDELELELCEARIPAARRRRIVAELADHLASEPGSEERLGSPTELARQFADELGTVVARRTAFATFLALVPLGVLFVALYALTGAYITDVDTGLMVMLVWGSQLAFVGGTLAFLRAWRLRQAVVIPAAEARVLVRRAGVGLVGGGMTVAALAALAFGPWGLGVQWSLPFVSITVVVGAVCLLGAAAVIVRSGRLLPAADGAPADLAFDLGVPASPWRLALAISGALAVCIALAGFVHPDPIDGLARAVAEGLLCLAGFALLGRRLGLRA